MMNLFTSLQARLVALQSHLESDERGAAAVEYALLVSLIAIVIIAAVTLLGTNIRDAFNSVAGSIG